MSTFLKVSSREREQRTSERHADNVLAAIKLCYAGEAKNAPLDGGTRARQRKIANDGLRITLDEFVRVLADRDGRNAAYILRMLVRDAGLDDRIAVSDSQVEVPPSLSEAELRYALSTGAVLSAADEIRARRTAATASGEYRLQQCEQQAEEDGRALLCTAARHGSDDE